MSRLNGLMAAVCAAVFSVVAPSFSGSALASQVALSRVTVGAPITLGFSGGSDTVLASGDASTQAQWAPIARSEGAQMLRLDVNWSQVAPTVPESGFDGANPADPGYDWTGLDERLREISAIGGKVMMTISIAPTWAEGANPPAGSFGGAWEPSARDFGEFAHAIAERYDGRYPDPLNPGEYLPRVSIWQGWNEPNVPEQLAPQYVSTKSGVQETGATIYRNLENAFYKAVKGVSKSNYVVLAGLAPYGDSPAVGPDVRTRPVAFLRSLLCVTAGGRKASECAGPTDFDAIDSHPYGIYGPNWHAYWANDVSVPDVHKLAAVLAVSQKLGTALPVGPKADWVTETSYNSSPPNPGGVPVNRQALWLEESIYNFWKQGVSTMLWWQLADDPLPVTIYNNQAGTYLISGEPKPSATAFRFPFLSHRMGRKTVMAWSRSPASGVLSVQKRTGGGWKTIARASVKADEVFELPLALPQAATLRAQVSRYTSLTWAQSG